jgi:hypothetical protein
MSAHPTDITLDGHPDFDALRAERDTYRTAFIAIAALSLMTAQGDVKVGWTILSNLDAEKIGDSLPHCPDEGHPGDDIAKALTLSASPVLSIERTSF